LSLGLLAHGDEEERFTKSRSEIEAHVAIALGGLISEEVFLGESGTGPASDLAGATQLAAQMVGSFGMDGSLIPYDAIAGGPIGKLRGSLAGLSAVDLGAAAIREALKRSGVSPERVDYVIMGHVIQAGTGQITGRQAAVAAGIPKEVPAITINKVCPSALTAIALADQLIRAGEVEIVVAGGMESMTQ